MTRGTRVFLLIAGLFVGVLVVYYGFYTDTMNPEDVAAATDDADSDAGDDEATDTSSAPDPAAAEPASTTPSPRTSRPTTPRAERETNRETTPPVNVPERRLRDPLTEAPSSARTPPAADPTPVPQRTAPPESGTKSGAESPRRAPNQSPGGRAEPPRSNRPASNQPTPKPASEGNVSSNQPASIANRERRYVIQKDDSLYRIAERELGDPQQWRRILAANPGLKADALPIGDSIVIPARETARSSSSPKPTTGPVTHVVRSGDSLSSIAGRYYGDESKWRTIYDANRRVIGEDPDALKLGMKLVVPAK